MHRVRHMLNHIGKFDWEAEVVAVDPKYNDIYSKDELLIKTIPSSTKIHWVRAFKIKYTRRVGLGSISMRSYIFYKKYVNKLLNEKKFDVIFFSTTAFHVMSLGPYWKRKFGIPFVLDIQDPWRSDYYLDKPKSQRPPKFWISYYIDKFLEKNTVPQADALISVSNSYLDAFYERYLELTKLTYVIPFSIDKIDFEVARSNKIETYFSFDSTKINIVYIGRGGHDLSFSIGVFFQALLLLKQIEPEIYSRIRCFFIGTSYAAKGCGMQTIKPIADKLGLGEKIIEVTDRIPYFNTLNLLKSADLFFLPGSIDEGYTASKIYPYVLAEKPIISIFHEKSSVVKILKDCTKASVVTFCDLKDNSLYEKVLQCLLLQIQNINVPQKYDEIAFEPYMANSMTKKVVEVFNEVCRI